MTRIGVREMRERLGRGEFSVTEHVQDVLNAIAEQNPRLGAFFSIAGDEAMRAARVADARIREVGPAAWHHQPLLGVPVAVKDLVQTADLPTTRGSLLPNPRPPEDAPAVARLREAGAIIIGKTATSEYGWSASTVSRVAGPVRSPWDPERTVGGSSGGSAAAVAAGLCSAALGTDGAGSIRIPAAFCGVVGFKPSFGRVPYVPTCADRLAHLGPMTKDVADAVVLTKVLAGPHPLDPDSAEGPALPPRAGPVLRIGWVEFPGTSAEVRDLTLRAVELLEALGHHVEPVEVPFPDPYPALVDILAASEAASTSPDDAELCDPGRAAVARYGRTLGGAAVIRAEEARMALRVRLRSVMTRYQLLAMATVPIEPFGAGAIGPDWAADPDDLLWLAWAPACYPFNMTGQPALSLPVGLTSAGLPVGLQLVGRVGADDLVLSTARSVEAALDALPAAPEVGAPVAIVSASERRL